ncbi:MAG TPA: DUF2474 family protein [Pinirhizobacter sp.]|nr:DUF2474 family protein [Pinirhizobacter sp.]HMH67625.1 DUF2474 family protein [Pinirhizobacter sp.]
MDKPATKRLVWKRLGWFVLLYAGGVLAVGIVALIFRVLVLNAVR